MATLATIFDRIMGSGSVAEAAYPVVRTDADEFYKLRALPNEDVYFFVKRIDNSRVVRQADPGAHTWGLRFIGGAVAGAVILIGLLLPSAYGLMAGYQLSSLKQEEQRLLAERATLDLEEAKLISAERLQELARIQQFVDPAPGKVIHLTPPDDKLAFNRR
jgi:hypothetical protein